MDADLWFTPCPTTGLVTEIIPEQPTWRSSMSNLKQSTPESRQTPRPHAWLFAPIMAVALVRVWAIGAHTAPAASTTALGEQSASAGPFLSPPEPFLSPLLEGQVALEQRGLPGDPRWITPLYRDEGGIKIYEPGTDNLLGAYSATTDANGAFSVILNDLYSGVYDIRIKGADTLSVKKVAVTVPSTSAVDFGTLLVGDSTGNDVVNADDVSYMVPSFLRCTGNASYRIYADTNKSGCVNGLDVSALVPNFLRQGPVLAGLQTRVARSDAAAASLTLSPSAPQVIVNETFTIDIMANAGDGTVDTVQAYITFNPAYLKVVGASGQPATEIELNTAVFTAATWNVVDNAGGRIDLSATRFNPPYLSGTFKVATIRLKAKAETDGTNLALAQQAEPRLSDLSLAGTSLSPTITGATVEIHWLRKYLPIVRR
jgi:hypothetical protein